jgi:hypothetical protein
MEPMTLKYSLIVWVTVRFRYACPTQVRLYSLSTPPAANRDFWIWPLSIAVYPENAGGAICVSDSVESAA